jgi:ribosome-binding ATPase YchF (GTP1/OBG family)
VQRHALRRLRHRQALARAGRLHAIREDDDMEGREYVVADGDVMLFKFNV